MRRKMIKKTYTSSDKAVIALEALKGNMTINEITKKYGVHATQINHWKNQLKEGVGDIFANTRIRIDEEREQLIGELYKKIGQLEIERDWLKKKSEIFGRGKKETN
jgi:transposase